VQDALVKAYERRDQFAGAATIGPWLARVLYNRFIDNRRHYERQRLQVVSPAGTDDGAGPEQQPSDAPSLEAQTDLAFDISALRAGLAALSLEQRAVLLMHDAEGYKLLEIHEITGVEVGTLKSRLHRARRRLRDILAARGTF